MITARAMCEYISDTWKEKTGVYVEPRAIFECDDGHDPGSLALVFEWYWICSFMNGDLDNIPKEMLSYMDLLAKEKAKHETKPE